MTKIGFIYFTQTNVTGQLMAAAHSEIQGHGVECTVHQIQGKEIIEGRFKNPSLMEKLKT